MTEQRATERALRESEERFRRIANSAPVMMWVTRLDRVRDFVNRRPMPSSSAGRWRRRGRSTGARRSTPTTSSGWSPRAWPGRRRCSASRSRRATAGTTANIAGCARSRSPRFGAGRGAGRVHRGRQRHHSGQGSRARASPPGRGADSRAGAQRSPFRAVFDTVLEVLVLMEPDGTVVELNRKEAPWRSRTARDAVGKKIWDAPTLQSLSAAYRADEAGGEAGGGGQAVRAGGADGARRRPDRAPRRLGPAGARRPRQGHLFAVRSARHHRPQDRSGAAPPEPEDGGAGPAHRRHRPRLQQPADGRRRRPRHHRQARRRPEAQALCRQCAGGGRARGAADGAAARLQPGPAARGAADLCRAADPEHAAAAAQRARPRNRRSSSNSTRRWCR